MSLEIKLGLAGTAKNTGKTTTTAAIVQELRLRDIKFFLTSIGYDGENIDNITGLPKPKLRLEAGDIVATAEKCLKASTAVLKTIAKTDIATPLGKVIVARVEKPGLVVTAGPNKSSEVRDLARILHEIDSGAILFDGALNRIAPMVETDGFVLATGASRTPDIPRLAQETELVWRTCNTLVVPRAVEIIERNISRITLLGSDLEEIKGWEGSSLLSAEDSTAVLSSDMPQDSYLYIPGIISERALSMLADQFSRSPHRIILTFTDPIKLLVSGDINVFRGLIQKLEDAGVFVGVLKRVPLLAVTINPFYPEYRGEDKSYSPAAVDFVRLQLAVQKNIQVPVYNVVKQGAKGLVDVILMHAKQHDTSETVYF